MRAVDPSEGQQRLDAVLSALEHGVSVQELDGTIVYANPAAARFSGFATPAEMVGADPAAIEARFEMRDEHGNPLDPEVLPGWRLRRGLPYDEVLIQVTPRGTSEVRWTLVGARPIRGKSGELLQIVNVFRDVTERKRHQEALDRSREVSRRAMQQREFLSRASVELASSLDYNTTLATVARLAVPAIADWCAVDVVEDGEVRRLAVAHVDPARIEFVEDIQRRYPPDPDAANGVTHVLRTGESEMIPVIPEAMIEAAARDAEHLRLIRALELHSYLAVPMLQGNRAFGVITMAMAESRRTYGPDDLELAQALAERASNAVQNARLYRTAREARREAELANRAKDEFLAMLGHELRNPLTPIIAAIDLMNMQGVSGGEREREIVERQARSLVRLVDDLLDVSRITRGRIDLDKVPVDVCDVVAKGVEQASPLVESRDHELVIEVPRGMVVDADAMRLAQVVANLVTNAAKYTSPRGRIQIRGRREAGTIVLSVKDSGIGIAADMLPNVFDVFVQAPQTIERAAGGLGLGLTIVRRLVELHGGSVSAHSDGPGTGSEFVVCLPESKGRLQPADEAAAEPAAMRKATDGLSILVVDDNADVLEMMVRGLEMLGHRPHPACDGATALELAPTVHPELALIDLGLPGIDGFELARRLREVPGLARLHLVAVTGYGQRSDRDRTKEAGFDAHLVKPVGIDAVAQIIAELRGA